MEMLVEKQIPNMEIEIILVESNSTTAAANWRSSTATIRA